MPQLDIHTPDESKADAKLHLALEAFGNVELDNKTTEGGKLESLVGPISKDAREDLGGRVYRLIAQVTGELFTDAIKGINEDEIKQHPELLHQLMQVCADHGALSAFIAGMSFQKDFGAELNA